MIVEDLLRRVEPLSPNPDAGNRLVARQTTLVTVLFGLCWWTSTVLPRGHPVMMPVVLLTLWSFIGAAMWLPLALLRAWEWWQNRHYRNDGRRSA